MDRAIEKKTWTINRLIWLGLGVILAIAVLYMILRSPGSSTLRIDTDRITVATVRFGEFEDYYPFNASVEPLVSVYIDAEQGGRVEEILVEGGQAVSEGDLILRLSNTNMQRGFIDTETRLIEQLDRAQTTQFNRAQSSLNLEDQLQDMDYQILTLERDHERNTRLLESDAISREEFLDVEDRLNYQRQQRELLMRRIETENEITQRQLAQAEDSISRIENALELLTASVESLNIKAPITGQLSNVNAELGESITAGHRIGQIDVLDEFKLSVDIDQFYIDRVSIGTIGQLNYAQQEIPVEVIRIYPEVENNVFSVDMGFIDGAPEGLRRGQTLTVELSFGAPEQSLMVNKGGYYQETGGRWVYLINDDGQSARRMNIRLGRDNPRFVEVLEGLEAGDRIITSGYQSYNEVEELIFNEAI